MRAMKKAKLFVFLRNNRHEIFDEDFQVELGTLYQNSRLGHPPVPPAKLALATILQAYTGVSDEEAMEAMVMFLQNAGEIRASKKQLSWMSRGKIGRRPPRGAVFEDSVEDRQELAHAQATNATSFGLPAARRRS
jgi:hypothetical protein